MVQFIFAQNTKYLDVPFGMAREAAGEHIHQRAVMVQMLLEICHVDPGILLYSWSCDYSKPLFSVAS